MAFENWADIVAISASRLGDYVMGLRRDGTVAVTGDISNEAAREIRGWKNMISIEANSQFAYGVRTDGTVAAVYILGSMPSAYDRMMQTIEGWTDVDYVRAGYTGNVFAHRKDGTWVSDDYSDRRFKMYWYTTAVDVAPYGDPPIAALYADGSLSIDPITWDKPYDLSGWSGIRKMIMTPYAAFGLRQDGTVAVAGGDYSDAHAFDEVTRWRDLADIAADSSTVVGLKKDGTLLFSGTSIQYQAEEWEKVSPAAVGSLTYPRLLPKAATSARSIDPAEARKAIELLQGWESDKTKTDRRYTLSYCRTDYASRLSRENYSDDVIWYALENCGIDWNANALAYAQQRLDNENLSPLSRIKLMEYLRRYLFYVDEITYAAARWKADFKANAVACAQRYIKNVPSENWTRERMIRQLESESFTQEEITYAVNKLGLK